jgi:hypothetical protein
MVSNCGVTKSVTTSARVEWASEDIPILIEAKQEFEKLK